MTEFTWTVRIVSNLYIFFLKRFSFEKSSLINEWYTENQITIVKEYEINKPDIHMVVSIIDKFNRDCHNKYFHTFE